MAKLIEGCGPMSQSNVQWFERWCVKCKATTVHTRSNVSWPVVVVVEQCVMCDEIEECVG